MNLSTHKIIESAHVRIDEFAKRREEEINKEPEYYRRFVYYEPDTLPNLCEEMEASFLEVTKLQTIQPEP